MFASAGNWLMCRISSVFKMLSVQLKTQLFLGLPANAWANTEAFPERQFQWGRVLRSGGRVLRGIGAEFSVEWGPSSPRGRLLRGADFSMGPSLGLGRVLRGAEFSGIRFIVIAIGDDYRFAFFGLVTKL